MTMWRRRFGRLSDLTNHCLLPTVYFLLQKVHVRQLAGEFLHFVGVGHEGGACVPGAVEELTAGAVSKRELDGFVTHLERTAFGAGDEFFARVCFDPGENLVGHFVAYLVARHANGHTVTEEDFGVAFGDDGADAPALESLRSVFTAGTATEVLVRNENGAVLVGRIAERVNLALSGEASDIVGKGVVAEAFERDALEMSLPRTGTPEPLTMSIEFIF